MLQLPITLLLLAIALVPNVLGSALTVAIQPNEKVCFYADVDKAFEKIGFYFAVQSGGAFEISFDVHSPSSQLMLDGHKERQGDYVFTANVAGEYSFCFENDMSTLTEKLVDFDIMVESEPRREISAKPGQIAEHTSALEDSIAKLNGQLHSIRRTQRYFHTRENRGFAIVRSTRSRIFWYTVLESLAVIGMAIAQVRILEGFFNKTGRRYRV